MDKYTFRKIAHFPPFRGFNNKKHLKQKLRKKKFWERKNFKWGYYALFTSVTKGGWWVFVTTYNKQNWYAFCLSSTSPKC